MSGPKFTELLAGTPPVTPFVGPEALERRTGHLISLRLGANESLFGPSPKSLEAMQSQAEMSQYYGDPEGFELRTALAAKHGCERDNVVLASGIDELLSLFARAYLDPTRCAVTTLGSYPTFEFGVLGTGARIERVPYRDEAPDLEGLLAAAKEHDATICYVANPDNPSGALSSAESIAGLRARLPGSCVLLIDEAYADFVDAPELPRFAFDRSDVVRFRTFSKAYGMAGMRIGYALTSVENVAVLDKIRMHFGVNAAAQAGALAALSDDEWIAGVIAETADARAVLSQAARDLGFRPLPSHTNFLTIDVGSKAEAERQLEALLAKGVFVRKPAQPPIDGCIRVSLGPLIAMQSFIGIWRTVQ